MTHLRLLASLCVALGSGALVTACGSDSDADNNNNNGSLTVHNQSDFSIVELHVTQVGSSAWGPNLLGNSPLGPGGSVSLGVSCATYDALLVDAAGVDCQLHSVDLCSNNADWIILNNTCTVFASAKAARDAEAAKAGSATAPR